MTNSQKNQHLGRVLRDKTLILISTKDADYEILAKGSFEELKVVLEKLTEEKEKNGEMLVNEEITNNGNTIMREFATTDKGLVDTLVITEGIIGNISSCKLPE